jgi:hypothetical protein
MFLFALLAAGSSALALQTLAQRNHGTCYYENCHMAKYFPTGALPAPAAGQHKSFQRKLATKPRPSTQDSRGLYYVLDHV